MMYPGGCCARTCLAPAQRPHLHSNLLKAMQINDQRVLARLQPALAGQVDNLQPLAQCVRSWYFTLYRHLRVSSVDVMWFAPRSLLSPDKSTFFSFTHNVCGREIYAEGSVDAALFLAQQIRAGSEKKIFNMVDVLRAGAMR